MADAPMCRRTRFTLDRMGTLYAWNALRYPPSSPGGMASGWNLTVVTVPVWTAGGCVIRHLGPIEAGLAEGSVDPLLVRIGVTMMAQAFTHSSPETLFIATAFGGTALIVAPCVGRHTALPNRQAQ